MRISRHSVSCIALLAGLAGAAPAWAQNVDPAADTVQVQEQQQASGADQIAQQESVDPAGSDRVVVTGSFFAGTPEDAALPVAVFSMEELEEQGAPSALEFARNLSISGPTQGDAYAFGGGSGNVSYNLRGIGSDKTLTLLNGRRVSENANLIPGAALERTEVLKDGAAVIYGADASGGVVNFITRDNFAGLEVNGQYKHIRGSEGGDYSASVLGGFDAGGANFMWALEYMRRNVLETEERDFVVNSLDRTVNPFPWSDLSNLGVYSALGPRPATAASNTRTGEFGAAIPGSWADFTQASCEAIGGNFRPGFACGLNYIPFYNLSDDQDTYRAYAQFNSPLGDNIDFHVEATYGQVKTLSNFSPGPAMIRGPARAVGSVNQIYVPRENPGFADFATRSGLAASPDFASVAGVSPTLYRPYGHGGSPFWGSKDSINSTSDQQAWRVAATLSGSLGDFAEVLDAVDFDFGVTYNQSISRNAQWDIVGWKLQEALNGFGGPTCGAPDLNPLQFGTQNAAEAGKNGCQWFNPFASSFASNPQLGLANPAFVPTLENNSESLHDWMTDPWESESVGSDWTLDLVFSGETPLALPGGNVGLAAGTQWRQQEFRQSILDTYANGSLLCDWPSNFTTGVTLPDGPDAGTDPDVVPVSQAPRNTTDPLFTGCTLDLAGPGVFRSANLPSNSDLQNTSFFVEAQLPVFDNLNLQLAVRREEFSNDLAATVYKVAGKWDVFGPLSLRGSYGTNYQAPSPNLIPGEVSNGTVSVARAGGNWRVLSSVTRPDIKPETATAQNFGAIWQSGGFASDHDFTFIVDYFDIETEDEIGQLANMNDIINRVFSGAAVPGAPGFFFADCSSPFVGRVQFNDVASAPGGMCVQGVTTSDDWALVRTELGNGPGRHTAGFDIQTSYAMPIGPGDLTLSADATVLTKFDQSEKTLDGVVISPADDRLGFLNFENNSGNAAAEYRANAAASYRLNQHNFRLGVNYVSAVEDERTGIIYGKSGEDWIVTTFTYLWEIDETFRVSATVDNIFDRDPPPSQQEYGFDFRIANPLGRTFEIGIKKTF